MRKFTKIDTRNWKVVDVNGKTISFSRKTKEGKVETVTSFNGFSTALQAATRNGNGTPVRE